MELIALPRGTSAVRFNDRESIRSTEGRRRWTLTIRGTRTRRYSVQASLATLRKPFRPCRMTAGGKRVRFAYNRRTRVVTARVSIKRGRVVVHACS